MQALAIGVLISAAVAVGTINNNDTLEDILDIDDPTDELEEFQDDITGSRGTCSWLIFLSLVVFGVEGLWILLRFLNIGLVNLKIKIFLAIVRCGATSRARYVSNLHIAVFLHRTSSSAFS